MNSFCGNSSSLTSLVDESCHHLCSQNDCAPSLVQINTTVNFFVPFFDFLLDTDEENRSPPFPCDTFDISGEDFDLGLHSIIFFIGVISPVAATTLSSEWTRSILPSKMRSLSSVHTIIPRNLYVAFIGVH